MTLEMKANNDMEIRNVSDNIMSDTNKRTVEGYAVVFDSPSEFIGFKETIHSGAITDETIKRSDIYAKLNHNDEKILARSRYGEGSLKLEVDEIGLRYSFDAPNTIWGDELLEHIKRGEINSSSFAFSINKQKRSCEKWSKDKDGKMVRDIYEIEMLYDISPVYNPAYPATTCSKRFNEVEEISKQIDTKYQLMLEEVKKL